MGARDQRDGFPGASLVQGQARSPVSWELDWRLGLWVQSYAGVDGEPGSVRCG